MDPNGRNIGLEADGYISYQGLPFLPRMDEFQNNYSQKSIGSWYPDAMGNNLNNRCYISRHESTYTNPHSTATRIRDIISQSTSRTYGSQLDETK